MDQPLRFVYKGSPSRTLAPNPHYMLHMPQIIRTSCHFTTSTPPALRRVNGRSSSALTLPTHPSHTVLVDRCMSGMCMCHSLTTNASCTFRSPLRPAPSTLNVQGAVRSVTGPLLKMSAQRASAFGRGAGVSSSNASQITHQSLLRRE